MLLKLSDLQKCITENNIDINEKNLNTLYNAFKHYEGGIIPAGTIRRILNINFNTVYDLLISLEELGVLKAKFKVKCYENNISFLDCIYEDIKDIPKKKNCDKCDKGCLYLEHVVVEFKVI